MADKSKATYAGQPPTNGLTRQCEAAVSKDTPTRKKGERCPNPPIRGGNVCMGHGGRASQVRESAQLRLARLVDPGINLLADVITLESRRAKRALRAKGQHAVMPDLKQGINTVQDILDRTGFKGKQEVDITSHQNVNMSELTEEHLRAILALKEQLATKTPQAAAEKVAV